MRICKKCGIEFETHGRALQICANCRAKKDIEKEQEKRLLDAEKKKPSTLIGIFTNGLPTNDFLYFKEELHHTGNTYHLHCEGGPMSKYSKIVGRDTMWGKQTITLSASQAKEWAQSHNLPIDFISK